MLELSSRAAPIDADGSSRLWVRALRRSIEQADVRALQRSVEVLQHRVEDAERDKQRAAQMHSAVNDEVSSLPACLPISLSVYLVMASMARSSMRYCSTLPEG